MSASIADIGAGTAGYAPGAGMPLFGLTQVAIGIGLLCRRTVKPALAVGSLVAFEPRRGSAARGSAAQGAL